MTEFYCPSPRTVTVPGTKRRFALRRGIQEIPDSLANHLDANALGIIPLDEMTDAQWKSLALNKAACMAARASKVVAATPVPVPSVSASPAKASPTSVDPIAAAAASVKATNKS